MPRISPVTANDTDTATAETLAAVQDKLGMLPNLFSTLAQSPAALNGYLQLSEAMTGGRLSARQRELIAIAVAQENACEYCLSAHIAIGQGVGLNQDAIDQARKGSSDNPINDAIINFALRVVQARGGVSDADVEEIRNACDDDGVILEIVANVVLNILTNYVNRVAGTEVDFPHVQLDNIAA
jgi:uncharacterized peroxidase-related enzyme